jgi:hypothetical protein
MEDATGEDLVILQQIGNGAEVRLIPLHQADGLHGNGWQGGDGIDIDVLVKPDSAHDDTSVGEERLKDE